jgi:hypothetical protein
MGDDLSRRQRVYYQLVGPPGSSYMMTFVEMPPDRMVGHFKEKLRDKHVEELGPWDTSKIKIFRNQAAFEAKETPLGGSKSMTGLGDSRNNALIVLVPTTRDIYVKFSEKEPAPLKMHAENLQGLMVQKLFTAGDLIKAFLPDASPLSLRNYTLYHNKDEADENETLREISDDYQLSQLAADEGTYERPLILRLILSSVATTEGILVCLI